MSRRLPVSMYKDVDVLGVACDKCGASATERCRTDTGNPTYDLHMRRITLAMDRNARRAYFAEEG